MNELEAKKRALVAESEVYREMLKLELHNLRLYVSRTKHKLKSFRRPNPLLMLLAPLAGAFFRKRFAPGHEVAFGITVAAVESFAAF